ncbi:MULTISPECIES: hypothetical protein [Bacillus]|uniref:hypothetical protein n=1 Tax=Bacillus TaxID=1386 RepID=UPI001C2500F9|nr:hypothetical protein [Bacillus glycinifermentans]
MKYTLPLNMTAIRRFFIKPYTPFAEIGLRFTENAASENNGVGRDIFLSDFPHNNYPSFKLLKKNCFNKNI